MIWLKIIRLLLIAIVDQRRVLSSYLYFWWVAHMVAVKLNVRVVVAILVWLQYFPVPNGLLFDSFHHSAVPVVLPLDRLLCFSGRLCRFMCWLERFELSLKCVAQLWLCIWSLSLQWLNLRCCVCVLKSAGWLKGRASRRRLLWIQRFVWGLSTDRSSFMRRFSLFRSRRMGFC